MGLLGDLRFGFRLLIRNRGFTFAAAFTMALGIGANTAVFSIVNALLLRPLPGIADPSRLVSLYRLQNGEVFDNLGYPDYDDYYRESRTLELVAHAPAILSFSHGVAERLSGDLVTDNYFPTLGVQPQEGRLLGPKDDASAVISYGLWQRQFGGDPAAVGSKIEIFGSPFTIVGVAEKNFRGTVLSFPFDLWIPLRTQPRTIPRLGGAILANRSAGWIQVFGRLRPGASLSQASAEMKILTAQVSHEHPLTNEKRSIAVAAGVGTYPDDRAEVSGLLGLLSGSVALLLLIACANVAGLLIVRAIGRSREIAVRLAIGAGPSRIVQQLLTEGVILSLIAGSAGVVLAGWIGPIIAAAGQGSALSLIRHAGATLDTRVLAFTLLLSIVTGLMFAIAPALQARKVDLTQSLKSGLPGSGVRTRFRSVLAIGQVALSFVLVSGAGLLLASLHQILTANPGFDSSRIAFASVDLTLSSYSEEKGRSFYRDLLARLSASPGVISASLAGTIPPTQYPGTAPIFYPDQEPAPEVLQARSFELGLRVTPNLVAPYYFATLGIPLLQGRDFDEHDQAAGPAVVIVSRTLAERLWPGQNPLGKRIAYPRWGGPRRPPFEVIGVAEDVRHKSLTSHPPLLLYVPIFQEYNGRMNIVVRTASDPQAGVAIIQKVVTESDRNVRVYSGRTGNEHVADSLWQQRVASMWTGGFGIISLVLAAIGLYGVIAQSVAHRTREIGIRIALGAGARTASAMVIRQGMVLAFAGIAIGIPTAIGFTRLMGAYLQGIDRADPVMFATVALLLGTVMFLACWSPARRAARIDPVQALRCD